MRGSLLQSPVLVEACRSTSVGKTTMMIITGGAGSSVMIAIK